MLDGCDGAKDVEVHRLVGDCGFRDVPILQEKFSVLVFMGFCGLLLVVVFCRSV